MFEIVINLYFGQWMLYAVFTAKLNFKYFFSNELNEQNDNKIMLMMKKKQYIFIRRFTSTISVRFTYGLKNKAIDLWDKSNRNAFMNRMPWMVLMSLGFLFMLTSDLIFFHNENAINNSSETKQNTKKNTIVFENLHSAIIFLNIQHTWRFR